MNIKHFDYFIAIAETGSLSNASRRLGITQPVLSRYLANLEEELGLKLFVQEKRRFHITAAGQIYLNGIRRMKELQTQMTRSFELLQGNETLSLRIGMSPYRGGLEIASFYPHLLERYPNLDLTVEEGNSHVLAQKLYRKELSAIINLYAVDFMPGTKIATLIKTELLLVLPSYHPLCAGGAAPDSEPGTITVEQLCSLTDIPFVYMDSNSIIGQMIDQLCLRYHFSPLPLLRTSNAIAVSSLLSSGSYAGFVLENTRYDTSHLVSFHLPHPVYLYSGIIFLEDHQPTEVEQYLYQLEYQQARATDPNLLSINDFGKRLLNAPGKEQVKPEL